MNVEQPMAERTAQLFDGIRGVLEGDIGGRINVDKWLDPMVGPGRGRDRVNERLALCLGAVDQVVSILPGAIMAVDRNEVSVTVGGGSSLVASFGFGRLDLIERRARRDRILGSFAHDMGIRAFLWRLAVMEWGDACERGLRDTDSLQVIRTSRGVSFNVRSGNDLEGPSAIVWDAEDAISFARGCALEIEALLAITREFVARGSSVTTPRLLSFEDRALGCLLGGAVGDALGYPVEFSKLDAIIARVGAAGVREFLAMPGLPLGAVSDDTQMTLFTADALARRDDCVSVRALMVDAYRDWYLTQIATATGSSAVMPASRRGSPLLHEGWLFAQRAPGLTIMDALRQMPVDMTAELVPDARNQSKGCGTVMRSAPFGLILSWTPEQAYEHAAQSAAITHGHPTAHVAAGALAMLVRLLVAGQPLSRAVAVTLVHVVNEEPDGLTETSALLRKAANPVDGWSLDHLSVDTLGEGWVAEEALAIAVYCALRFPGRDQVEDALVFAVTHSGDSDSTGSICGNILGALHGVDAIPDRWRNAVEGRDTILAVAGELANSG